MKSVTKNFTVTAAEHVMERIERFLAMLHWNSAFGHSGTFAMPLDGDGEDKVQVEPEPYYRADVDVLGGIGYDVELAIDGGYSGFYRDRQRLVRRRVRGGEVINTEEDK